LKKYYCLDCNHPVENCSCPVIPDNCDEPDDGDCPGDCLNCTGDSHSCPTNDGQTRNQEDDREGRAFWEGAGR